MRRVNLRPAPATLSFLATPQSLGHVPITEGPAEGVAGPFCHVMAAGCRYTSSTCRAFILGRRGAGARVCVGVLLVCVPGDRRRLQEHVQHMRVYVGVWLLVRVGMRVEWQHMFGIVRRTTKICDIRPVRISGGARPLITHRQGTRTPSNYSP